MMNRLRKLQLSLIAATCTGAICFAPAPGEAKPLRIRIANPALTREQAFVANPQGARPKTKLSRTKGIRALTLNPVHTDAFTINDANLLGSPAGSAIQLAAVTREVSNFYDGGGHERDEGRTERVQAVVGLDSAGKAKFMALGTVRAKNKLFVAVVDDDVAREASEVSLVSRKGVEETFRIDGKVNAVSFGMSQQADPIRLHNGSVVTGYENLPILRMTTTVKGHAAEVLLSLRYEVTGGNMSRDKWLTD
ncbi:MAG: hypothetical protein IPL79_16730 [Myxococcales bacterium]|nr:hypothetical protein [Myxococcales bacterium]